MVNMQDLEGKPVRDFVVPVGTATEERRFTLEGTAFFI
jgi:hypothetical protein